MKPISYGPPMDDILKDLLDGKITLDDAKKELELRLYGSHHHTLDTGREHRTGVPEVIIAEGKHEKHLKDVSLDLLERKGKAMISRLTLEGSRDLILFLSERMPDLEYELSEEAGFITIWKGERGIEQNGGR